MIAQQRNFLTECVAASRHLPAFAIVVMLAVPADSSKDVDNLSGFTPGQRSQDCRRFWRHGCLILGRLAGPASFGVARFKESPAVIAKEFCG